jgi:predicted nucleic-acid-binding Zn-ribbon protein
MAEPNNCPKCNKPMVIDPKPYIIPTIEKPKEGESRTIISGQFGIYVQVRSCQACGYLEFYHSAP